jgi:ubiquinone/menaquinone biosynthesis C-methylase UbiE
MNKKLWDMYAPIYELAMRADMKIYRFMYDRIPTIIKDKEVLELATGPGLLAKHVAPAAKRMIATDYSDGMIAKAKMGDCPSNLSFEVADATALPYEDNAFDVVIISNALHIIPEPERALKEIDRVLRDDGILIAPNFVEHQTGLGSRIWSGILNVAGVKFEHQWSSQEYLDWLDNHGWEVTYSKEMAARITLMYAECKRRSALSWENDEKDMDASIGVYETKTEKRERKRNFTDNFGNPRGLLGRMMLVSMDKEHLPMAEWGFRQFEMPQKADILDIGCGGGYNIQRMLKRCPEGKIVGYDISKESVKKARAVNKGEGRVEIHQGSVEKMPFRKERFDLITAFETVFFWPDTEGNMQEVYRVMKPGGLFVVINNYGDPKIDWEKKIPCMKRYTAEEIGDFMENAGFTDITISKKDNLFCVFGKKPQ